MPAPSDHHGQASGVGPERKPLICLDEIFDQRAHLTTLDEFIAENDARRALEFWFNYCSDAEFPSTTTQARHLIEHAVVELDHRINDQLNAIIHHPKLQKLEASWRGLWYLAVQMESVKNAKLKVLDITWAEVVRDISRAMEFDQSQLFQKVYSEEYGTPGGEPYGVLVGDYEIHHKPSEGHPYDDITTLEGLAEIAAASFSPFIAGAAPELFGLDQFSDLRLPLNLQAIFAQTEYVRWRSMRNKPDTRFVGLTLPRTLMRRPYRTTPGSHKGLFFYEKLGHNGHQHYLWGNACYAFAGILIREFASVGWFGHIRGVPRDQIGGGIVTNLPCDVFSTDSDDIAWKPVTDVVITDSIERDISNLGFVPLCQCYATPYVAFYSNPSIHMVKKGTNKEAEINARLAGMLQHVLCGSRVAHYIKVMIRDKIGSFISAQECENFLRDWLFQYTTGREDLDWETQARYPLREAAVKVNEHPAKPGYYTCTIHLVPHYQADQMVSELELVTEVIQSGGGN